MFDIHLHFFSRFRYPSQKITLHHTVNTSYAPVGIAVDSANDHIYWVNDAGDTISRCNLDGTNVILFYCVKGTVEIQLDLKNRYIILTYFYHCRR